MSKDQRRFMAIPFSSSCRSGSSVDVVDTRHGKKPQQDGAPAKPKGESLVARLLKGFKNLSQIFAVYEEDEEEEEREMVIGLPTDVKHVAHIGRQHQHRPQRPLLEPRPGRVDLLRGLRRPAAALDAAVRARHGRAGRRRHGRECQHRRRQPPRPQLAERGGRWLGGQSQGVVSFWVCAVDAVISFWFLRWSGWTCFLCM